MTGQERFKYLTMDINQAHEQYGHVSEAALRTTLKSINVRPTGNLRACEGCALAKAKAKSVPKVSTVRTTFPGERLYVDISGPYKQTFVGSKYWILFVGDYSRKSWSFFTTTKGALSEVADGFFSQLQNTKTPVHHLRCNNAGENLSKLQSVCNKYNIKMEYTAPNTPQQNGVVERKFVTLCDRSCAMTFNAKWSSDLREKLWAESIHTSELLTNIVANSRNVKSPNELFSDRNPLYTSTSYTTVTWGGSRYIQKSRPS